MKNLSDYIWRMRIIIERQCMDADECKAFNLKQDIGKIFCLPSRDLYLSENFYDNYRIVRTDIKMKYLNEKHKFHST